MHSFTTVDSDALFKLGMLTKELFSISLAHAALILYFLLTFDCNTLR